MFRNFVKEKEKLSRKRSRKKNLSSEKKNCQDKKKYCEEKRKMVQNKEKCERIRIPRNSDFKIDIKLVELANAGSTSLESRDYLEPNLKQR